MKRKYILSIIVILAAIIIFLYLQCQGKEKISRPRETVEAPAVAQPEKRPGVPSEEVTSDMPIAPPEEKAAKERKESTPVLETQIKKEETIPSAPEPEVIIPEQKEEELTVLPEQIIEPLPSPGKLPTVTLEKPSEKIEEEIAIIPAKTPRKQAKELLPELKIDPVADPAQRIAILPFDNLTDNAGAGNGILPWIKDGLKTQGYEVIDEQITDKVLCSERIRLATDLPREVTREIGNTLKAGTMLAGTIFAYTTDQNPGVGISARLIDTTSGSIVWANYASDTGEDFTGLLGLGTITSIHTLIPKVTDKLLATFKIQQHQAEPESMYKVAVIPFLNLTKNRHAGMIVTQLFLVQLFKNKIFDPIEYGDIRKIIVDLRVRRKGELSYDKLNDLSRAVGAGIILTGTVEAFSEGVSDVYPPKVSISARLLDARNNKVVWFDALALDGEDKITAFEWGKIRSPDKVASVVVSDLVKNMEKTKWH